MNTVKDFTIGQRVSTDLGDGTVTKIGRVYVYVDIDGSEKAEKMTPGELRESSPTDEIPAVDGNPIVVIEDEAHVAVPSNTLTAGRKYEPTNHAASHPAGPAMRLKGKRADADNRRKARKAQRKSRRANRR